MNINSVALIKALTIPGIVQDLVSGKYLPRVPK